MLPKSDSPFGDVGSMSGLPEGGLGRVIAAAIHQCGMRAPRPCRCRWR